MHADAAPHPATARARHSLDRLVFFSDAVFAIAITLLVIDLRVPEHLTAPGNAGLISALLEAIPQLVGFAISFAVIGVFWASHHRAFALLSSGEGLLGRNLLFLFTIALMPFPTVLISRYASLPISQQVYTATLFLAGVLQLHLFRRALTPAHLAPDVLPEEAARLVRRAWAVPIGPALAFAAATIAPTPFSLATLLVMPFVIRLAGAAPWRRWRRSTT